MIDQIMAVSQPAVVGGKKPSLQSELLKRVSAGSKKPSNQWTGK